MTSPTNSPEPTRPIPMPVIDEGGNMHAVTTLSPKQNTTRAGVSVPPDKVMPVIVVPGIMGSNLRASAKGGNKELKPGEPAWRPPNGIGPSIDEVKRWRGRTPSVRQKILDGDTLEVDPTGQIMLPPSMPQFTWDESTARKRGWGEIHASSYGSLLVYLQQCLNSTFRRMLFSSVLEEHWVYLNKYDRAKWNTTKDGVGAELTDVEMKKFAEFHYPVYAFGYNWLQSNEVSAAKLRARIEEIIADWKGAKKVCDSVLLVTHSMGGLVSRACAKQIPDKITGIIHGVMPALGAPVCYRRVACGTERSSPTNSALANKAAEGFSDIAGKDSAETTPVLAVAPGPLELLPNHLYQKPWLFVETMSSDGKRTSMLEIPTKNPYGFYADLKSWYRAIDPVLADPAGNYGEHVEGTIHNAISQAKRFHMEVLGTYYHPQTYVFYGDDDAHASFGSCRWTATSQHSVLSAEKLKKGTLRSSNDAQVDERCVDFEGGLTLRFKHSIQDTSGDGTVPSHSGAGLEKSVLQAFRVHGFDHQGSYSDPAMQALTLHLIAKLVQKK
jgi:pimeloyl-ACP methyl ester carboxylesterase